MKKKDRLKRWELAMMLSLCLTLGHGFLANGAHIAWWGVIFPGLTDAGAPAAVEAAKLETGSGVELRFQLLDWLEGWKLWWN